MSVQHHTERSAGLKNEALRVYLLKALGWVFRFNFLEVTQPDR